MPDDKNMCAAAITTDRRRMRSCTCPARFAVTYGKPSNLPQHVCGSHLAPTIERLTADGGLVLVEAVS